MGNPFSDEPTPTVFRSKSNDLEPAQYGIRIISHIYNGGPEDVLRGSIEHIVGINRPLINDIRFLGQACTTLRFVGTKLSNEEIGRLEGIANDKRMNPAIRYAAHFLLVESVEDKTQAQSRITVALHRCQHKGLARLCASTAEQYGLSKLAEEARILTETSRE